MKGSIAVAIPLWILLALAGWFFYQKVLKKG